MARRGSIQRTTKETSVRLEIELDGLGSSTIQTGVGFLDHMLDLLARHAVVDLEVQSQGDLHVDQHHLVEDVGICLGQAVREALGDKAGIRRYGQATLPMDETLATAAVDLGGRPFIVLLAQFPSPKIGDFDSELVEEFWRAFAFNALCNLHLHVHYGSNSHHISEAIFKSAARALRSAMELDPRVAGIPSTKGTLG